MSLDLLYDADCGFCQKSVNILKKLDKRNALNFLPLQDPESCGQFGVSQEQASLKIHAKDIRGHITSGALSINQALDTALGTTLFQKIYSLPLISFLQEKAYAYIALNRYRLPGSNGSCAVKR